MTGKCIAVNNERQGNKMKTYKLIEKPIAMQAITAYVGMGIFEIHHDVDDYVKTAGIMGDKRTTFVWCKVRTDKHGAMYFNRLGERYYLHDMLRFNH